MKFRVSVTEENDVDHNEPFRYFRWRIEHQNDAGDWKPTPINEKNRPFGQAETRQDALIDAQRWFEREKTLREDEQRRAPYVEILGDL